MTESIEPYRCPRCRHDAPLRRVAGEGEAEALGCAQCDATYPIVCGIPDLRTAPDPYIGLEADRAKARGLADRFDELGFEALVDHYFAITPEVPTPLAARYRAGLVESGPPRLRGLLERIDHLRGVSPSIAEPSPATALEVGCGSGPFLPLLVERFHRVVAVDVALRWLVIARKRLEAAGVEQRAHLVCANAESLPLADARFDVAVATNTLEHLREPDRALRELRRCLVPDGIAGFTAPNRFSPGPDPHVGVWGIGFLPRRWQDAAARRVRGVGFDRVHTRGHRELRRMLSRAGLRDVAFACPPVDAAALAHLGQTGRTLGKIYNRLCASRLAQPLLREFGPMYHITARR